MRECNYFSIVGTWMTDNTPQKWGFACGDVHRTLLALIPLFLCVYISVFALLRAC